MRKRTSELPYQFRLTNLVSFTLPSKPAAITCGTDSGYIKTEKLLTTIFMNNDLSHFFLTI